MSQRKGRGWRWASGLWIGAVAIVLCQPSYGRPVPDETLGSEGSQVIDRSPINFDIGGGARRGANLFHSFQEFGVDAGGSVYFLNPTGIENIFSRVTGANRSDILGRLGVRGGANLFLMNPNGILFGQNASLDVQGSFMGTTANAIGFGEQGVFSASGSEVPQNLLTINPSAFLFNSPLVTSSSITVQGNGQGIRSTTTPIDTNFGLRVPGDQTFSLVGGNLLFEGATLKTDGGRIELGSVASGSVGLVPVTDGWALNYTGVPAFQDIQLSQQAVIDASGLGGGNIQVRGSRIALTGGSQIEASTLGSQPGGSLDVTANDAVNIRGAATDRSYTGVFAQSYSGSIGAGGNITVRANIIRLNGLAAITTTAYGSGRAGDLSLRADQGIEIDGAGVLARVDTDVSGTAGARGGDLTITTPRLSVRGAQISASANGGTGQAGNLTVSASESVDLSGEIPGSGNVIGFPGGLFSIVDYDAAGRGGNLRIETEHLSISDGSKAQAISFGDGDAGNVFILADRVEVFETDVPNIFQTGIFIGTGVAPRNTELPRGNGGNLTINASEISVQGGGVISANTSGQGNAGTVFLQARNSIVLSGENLLARDGSGSPGGVFAQVESGAMGRGGNLRVETDHLSISDGSKVQVGTFGQGDAGDLFIDASDINVFNTSNPYYFTGIFAGILQDPNSTVLPRGNGGSLTIETDRLSIRDGARVTADVSGAGNGGDILIQARDLVEVVGIYRGGNAPSTLGAEVAPQEVNTPVSLEPITGQGGDLTIRARQLSVRDGGRVTVSTFGNGDAGNIVIQNAQLVNVTGQSSNNSPSSIRANVGEGARGRGGNIIIETAQLSARDGGQVSASTSGSGSAGSIRVQDANSIVLDNASISTAINSGATTEQPSNINLQTRLLSLNNGADITASTSGQGNAGAITVLDANTVNLDRSTISSTVNPGAVGDGGSITLNTDVLNLDRSDITSSTSGRGNAGNITVQDANSISLTNSKIATEVATQSAIGRGGNINLDTDTLSLNQGQVSSSTTGQGDTGSITVQANQKIDLGNSSSISSEVRQGAVGNSQNITLATPELRLQRNSQVSAATDSRGQAGSITIRGIETNTPANSVSLNNSNISTEIQQNGVVNPAIAERSNIRIDTRSLSLSNDARITASTSGQGNAGNINIRDANTVNLDRSTISSTVNPGATGNGGSISIQTGSLNLDRSDITASTLSRGDTGIVSIRADESIDLNRNSNITSEVRRGATGNSQNITLRTPSLSLRGNSQISSATNGNGRAGDIAIRSNSVTLDDGARISASTNGQGRAGNITVNANILEATNGGQIVSSTSSDRPAGSIILHDLDSITLNGRDSRISANTTGSGRGGRVTVQTRTLNISDGATLSTTSQSSGESGNLRITASDHLESRGGNITTRTTRTTGGDIQITGGNIDLSAESSISTNVDRGEGDGGGITITADALRLRDNSDIQTSVGEGAGDSGDGGDIIITADSVIAFDDSDIITKAPNQGGDITLNTPAFFGSGYQEGDIVGNSDGNGRVDLDASGNVSSGTVQTPNTDFIQNSLSDLPETAIDADSLIANSCIARTENGGTFLVTGSGGLPLRPGTAPLSPYPSGTVRTEVDEVQASATWRPGDAIVEPQGVYRLPDGQLVMSRECR